MEYDYLEGKLLEEYREPQTTEGPYLRSVVTRKYEVLSYNPKYGDDRVCECGHLYYRHFDSYENMSAVGCKYCECHTFNENPQTTLFPEEG